EPPPVPNASLDDFLAKCEAGVKEWRQGRVDYPPSVDIGLGETATFVAAVDVRDVPTPPEEVIGPGGVSEPVVVQCAVFARLKAIGDADALEIDQEDWVVRKFTPIGMIEWTWAVKATKIRSQDLLLELQPAILVDGELSPAARWKSHHSCRK
ncbi:MAG: hypothetical protein AB7J32_23960, partial [Pseudonocardia sp.]